MQCCRQKLPAPGEFAFEFRDLPELDAGGGTVIGRALDAVEVDLRSVHLAHQLHGGGEVRRSFRAAHDLGLGEEVALEQVEAQRRGMFELGVLLPRDGQDRLQRAGDVLLRVVASAPATAGLMRFDQLIASIARLRLWLTDAYFVPVPAYVQALSAAARDANAIWLARTCASVSYSLRCASK